MANIINIRRVDIIRPALDEYKENHPVLYSADARAIEDMVLNYSIIEKELKAANAQILKLKRLVAQHNDDKLNLSAALRPFLEPPKPDAPTCKNCSCWDFDYVQRGVAVGYCEHEDSDQNTTNEIFTCDLHRAIGKDDD